MAGIRKGKHLLLLLLLLLFSFSFSFLFLVSRPRPEQGPSRIRTQDIGPQGTETELNPLRQMVFELVMASSWLKPIISTPVENQFV
jgi:hypothetical protein